MRLVRLPDSDRERERLEALADNPRTDTTSNLVTGRQVLAGCELYGIERFGERVMTIAFDRGKREPLREIWIVGAVGGAPFGERPLLPEALDLIERETAVSFDVLALRTIRAGLVKQLLSRGYTADAVLRKRLHATH